MSQAAKQAPNPGEPKSIINTKEQSEFQKALAEGVRYTPYGENQEIVLTIRTVYQYLATPTWKGNMPTAEDCARFVMLCHARTLNPWAGDAFLVGYETKDGPKFECITAVAALLKRAEANPSFDGMQMGVIVAGANGEDVFREGDYVRPDEMLMGGWCKVYRKDKKFPYYAALRLQVYDNDKSRWKIDKGGMITKCAKAAALRNAFPTQLGGLYLREERDYEQGQYVDATNEARSTVGSRTERIASSLSTRDQAKRDEERDTIESTATKVNEEPESTPKKGRKKSEATESQAEGATEGATPSDDPAPELPEVLKQYGASVDLQKDVKGVDVLERKWVTGEDCPLNDEEVAAGRAYAEWKRRQLGGGE